MDYREITITAEPLEFGEQIDDEEFYEFRMALENFLSRYDGAMRLFTDVI